MDWSRGREMPRLARGSRNEQATSSTAKGPGANGRSFARNTPREKRREEETSGQIETQRRARENGIPLLPNRKREREREREREKERKRIAGGNRSDWFSRGRLLGRWQSARGWSDKRENTVRIRENLWDRESAGPVKRHWLRAILDAK